MALGRVALREVVLVEGRVEEGPFPEPVRLMELATELREAPELDLMSKCGCSENKDRTC